MLGLLLWGSPIFFIQLLSASLPGVDGVSKRASNKSSTAFCVACLVALGKRVSKSPPAMIGGVRRSREGVR